MERIKKGDVVMVIAGKDRGKSGKVMRLFLREGKAIVEGINYVKRHQRARGPEQPGGILQMELPVRLDKLMPRCPHCNKPTRIGILIAQDRSKSRICKKCRASI